MIRLLALALAVLMPCIVTAQKSAASKDPLSSPSTMQLINARASLVTYKGRRALELVPMPGKEHSDETILAVLAGPEFHDGTIELEVAGAPRPDAKPNMRGFIGIAFRVQDERDKYESFYLRPANARADDQLQRNHTLQYISEPDYGWKRLRTENPGLYESYADLVPGEWTKMKIVVSGDKAQLYVNGASQPALVVNDLKKGDCSGKIALWSHTSTLAYFSRLIIR